MREELREGLVDMVSLEVRAGKGISFLIDLGKESGFVCGGLSRIVETLLTDRVENLVFW